MGDVSWLGPRRSVGNLVEQHGGDVVVAACLDLLAGREVDGHILVGLGGPPARWAVGGGTPGPDYWLRVWALRGLLWIWDPGATRALIDALTDDAWRVREMAAKVAARHTVDEALPVLLQLRQDRVARVRAVAERAVIRLASAGSD